MLLEVLSGDVALAGGGRREGADVEELVAVIPALVIGTGSENEDVAGGRLGQSEAESEVAAILGDSKPGHRE